MQNVNRLNVKMNKIDSQGNLIYSLCVFQLGLNLQSLREQEPQHSVFVVRQNPYTYVYQFVVHKCMFVFCSIVLT